MEQGVPIQYFGMILGGGGRGIAPQKFKYDVKVDSQREKTSYAKSCINSRNELALSN